MSITTAQDIIVEALLDLGIVAEGETPTSAQMNSGFNKLNIMLDSWAARNLLTTAETEESFSLVGGIGTYTIGPSVAAPNFITGKPLQILSAYIHDGYGNDTPVNIITREEYNLFELKTNQGTPRNLFYDPGATQQASQIGTIKLYLVPDSTIAYALVIVTEKSFTEFASLTSLITFPPAYKKAFITNLEIEMAPQYGKSISPETAKAASDSLEIIETINSANKTMVMDTGLPSRTRVADILTGS